MPADVGRSSPIEEGRMSEVPSLFRRGPMRVLFDAGNVWKTGLVLVAVVATAFAAQFVLTSGRVVLYTILMAWFLSLAMEPAVSRLSRYVRRGAATALVMLSVIAFLVVFLTLFGQMFVSQMTSLIQSLPEIAEGVLRWVSRQFRQDLDLQTILDRINLTPENVAGYAGQIAGGVLVLLVSIAGGIAQFFMILLFTYYLSADGPRLRRWIAGLFPPRWQEVSVVVWDTTAEKTGRYVGARVVLAGINSTASALVFLVIGLPSWLPLAIWTGLVAQFVPAIGTYISITLPVIVGLLSPNPWLGVMVLAWGILYQQVENLTFEPRISARAVSVHPAVSFASVILGTSLFGVAGALLAIPVAAMLLSLLDLYRTRYELVPGLLEEDEDSVPGNADGNGDDRRPADDKRAAT
jgi:predicted PurR-regulated permease PerM